MVQRLIAKIVARRQEIAPTRALLVGISGIDGSGKGFITAKVAESLGKSGDATRVAVIGADAWLNLPAARFRRENPAEHFYAHAFRFEEMFERLVLPLQRNRAITLRMDYAEETSKSHREHRYQFQNIDVILLEGIFLFQARFLKYFDLTCWVECSFETALARALQRGQERLSAAETRRAFGTIYFPAQRIHFERDAPQTRADIILPNEREG